MTLQQLKYVITVAETGTITEAANKLYISQPSLTNAVHELEKEMNIVIFNRTNKGIRASWITMPGIACRKEAVSHISMEYFPALKIKAFKTPLIILPQIIAPISAV